MIFGGPELVRAAEGRAPAVSAMLAAALATATAGCATAPVPPRAVAGPVQAAPVTRAEAPAPARVDLPAAAVTASAHAGDPARGRAIAASRQQGLCLLCHAAPLPEPHLHGNLGPDLAGVASRLTPAQLRRKLLQPQADRPDSIMPAYGAPATAATDTRRVAPAWRDRPLLDAQQIEDVLAWLATLQ